MLAATHLGHASCSRQEDPEETGLVQQLRMLNTHRPPDPAVPCRGLRLRRGSGDVHHPPLWLSTTVPAGVHASLWPPVPTHR